MIRRIAFVVVTVGAVAAVHAQITGSVRSGTDPIDVPEGQSRGNAARAISDTFALCVVKQHYIQVRKMLAPPRDMSRDYKDLPKLMDNDCFMGSSSVARGYGTSSVEMTTNPVAFRGALYKALVRKDFARRAATFGGTALVMAGDNASNLQFADCVARAGPDDSLKLIRAIAGSPAETAAIGDLKPRLDQCTPPGTQMAFSRGNLVGYLAEAYYREADASKPAGSN